MARSSSSAASALPMPPLSRRSLAIAFALLRGRLRVTPSSLLSFVSVFFLLSRFFFAPPLAHSCHWLHSRRQKLPLNFVYDSNSDLTEKQNTTEEGQCLRILLTYRQYRQSTLQTINLQNHTTTCEFSHLLFFGCTFKEVLMNVSSRFHFKKKLPVNYCNKLQE